MAPSLLHMRRSTPVAISQSCSWCHELNELPGLGVATICKNCGHRADVPRIFCDCEGCCAMRAEQVALALTDADREQMTQWFADQLAQQIRNSFKVRTTFRAASVVGITYEAFRTDFVKFANSDAKTQGTMKALDALGIDVEVVLKRAFQTAMKTAVQ